jgi:hypothetical protein
MELALLAGEDFLLLLEFDGGLMCFMLAIF